MTKILIDGDSSKNIRAAEKLARRNGLECHIFCDVNHILAFDYAEVHIVEKRRDSADFALINRCDGGDIVITNDSGLAAMALSKGAKAVDNSGRIYTEASLAASLAKRYIRNKERRSTGRKQVKGFERVPKSDCSFYETLKSAIIESVVNKEKDNENTVCH